MGGRRAPFGANWSATSGFRLHARLPLLCAGHLAKNSGELQHALGWMDQSPGGCVDG